MWDFFCRIAALIVAMIVNAIILIFLQSVLSMIGIAFHNTSAETIIGFILFFGALIGIWFWGDGIPDYLYFRLSLGIPLTLDESRQCAFLLNIQKGDHWYSSDKWRTFDEIREFPREQRKDVLFQCAEKERPKFR